MGTNVSTVINTTIVKNTLTTAVSSLQQIQQENEQSTDVNQVVDITINGKLSCASLSVTQESKVSLRSYSAATAEQTLTMCQQVAQDLASNAKTEMAQTNKDLNILQTNIATTVNTAIADTTQEQIIAMTQTFQQTVSQTSDVSQHVIFTVGTEGEVFITGACEFTQNSTVDYTASQICNAAMNVITSQAAVQKSMTDWDTAIKQTNSGINLALILGLVFGILALIIILAVIGKFVIEPAIQRRKARQAAGGGKQTGKPNTTAKPTTVKPSAPAPAPKPAPAAKLAPVG